MRTRRLRYRPRAGFSLIELLVVIASASLLLALSLQSLHAWSRAVNEDARWLQWNARLANLSARFRADARSATAAAPIEQGRGLKLQRPDGAISYIARENAVIITRNDKPETIVLPGWRASLRLAADSGVTFAVLTLARGDSPMLEWSAPVGSDHRFADTDKSATPPTPSKEP